MRPSQPAPRSSGLSLANVLTVVFVVLKLTDNIDWSWWWVLSPLWIGWSLVALFAVTVILLAQRNP